MLEAVLEGMPRVVTRSLDQDGKLASRCASGDPQVFEEMYHRLGGRLKSVAFNHLGSMTDAEDAVQETFLKVHRAAATFTGEASFTTWVFRILINTCYDMLRKRKRRGDEGPLDDLPPATSSAAVDDLKRIALRRMLDSLPEQRRTVFTLFEIEGLSHAEIAEILNISEGNSKWILFATKKELQKQWKEAR
jgi:RNA polymerase sigma-70 factor (ECF subfamily)